MTNSLPGTRGTSARTYWILWLAGFFVWVATLLIASPWDLPVSRATADLSALFGRLVASIGEVPSWVAVVASLLTLWFGRREGSRLRRFVPLAWAIVVLGIIHPLLITQLLKVLWGRIRFSDLDAGTAGFTPFYIPAGVGAGPSFPSGHVAMALVVSPLVFFLARSRGLGPALLALALILAYGLGVAWGRILAGAHFLTDCLFSAGLSFLLAAVLARRWANESRACPSPGARSEP